MSSQSILSKLADEFLKEIQETAKNKALAGDPVHYEAGYLSTVIRMMILNSDHESSASFVRNHLKAMRSKDGN